MRRFLVLLTTLIALPALAASPRDQLLIDADALAKRLDDPQVVILHVGDGETYAAGHVPGARLIAPGMLQRPRGSDPAALLLELPDSKALQMQLQQLGVGRDSQVVVVFGKDEFAQATRLMFTLDAAGWGDRATLLDGGLPEWQRRGHALSTEVPKVTRTALTPPKMHPHAVDIKWLEEHSAGKDYVLIDARAPEYFAGTKRSSYPAGEAPAGRLPGAVNLPFSAVTDSDRKLKSTDELTALFAQAGVKKGDKVAVYCHIGQQASAVQFAARLAGIDAAIYDGSYQEWTQLGRAVTTN